MKYGSTVLIEVRGIWDKDPVFSRQLTISNTYNSRNALEEIKRELSNWFNTTIRVSNLGKDLSDADVLALAKSRGLITGDAPTSELYYVTSRSGKTNGHYIERFKDGTVTCTCPGFVNNNKCWASTGVSNSPDQYLAHKWASTRAVFEVYRQNEYGYN